MEPTKLEIMTRDYEGGTKLKSRASREMDKVIAAMNKKVSLLENVFPDLDLLSWSTSAVRIWCWMAYCKIADAHRAGLMPTLVIDRKDAPRSKKLFDKDFSMMHAENLSCYKSSGTYETENPRIPMDLMTVRSEIRVYQKNYDTLIKSWWNGHAPQVVHQCLMAHVLIHEMLHYITTSNLWSDQFVDGKDDVDAYLKYAHHVYYETSTVEDEVKNEALTLEVLRRLMLQGLNGVTGEGSFDLRLMPTVGGRFDLYKRSVDPMYGARMDAYEAIAGICGGYYFEGVNMDRIYDIIERQERQARDEHYHVCILD